MTPSVTERQLEVLQLRALGLTSDDVAHRIGVSLYTVKSLQQSAYRRLGAACLVDACRALGWLKVPEP